METFTVTVRLDRVREATVTGRYTPPPLPLPPYPPQRGTVRVTGRNGKGLLFEASVGSLEEAVAEAARTAADLLLEGM